MLRGSDSLVTKRRKLEREAREAMRSRGHRPNPFRLLNLTQSTTVCRDCGLAASVNSRPMPNEIEIGGSAVALGCDYGSGMPLISRSNPLRPGRIIANRRVRALAGGVRAAANRGDLESVKRHRRLLKKAVAIRRENPIGKHRTTIRPTETGAIEVTYHATVVARRNSDGTVTLNNGGYYTATTKKRINQALREWGIKAIVAQDKGKWWIYPIDYVEGAGDVIAPRKRFAFINGITISPAGGIINMGRIRKNPARGTATFGRAATARALARNRMESNVKPVIIALRKPAKPAIFYAGKGEFVNRKAEAKRYRSVAAARMAIKPVATKASKAGYAVTAETA